MVITLTVANFLLRESTVLSTNKNTYNYLREKYDLFKFE